MSAGINWFFVIVNFVSLLGFLVSIILYFANRDETFTPKLLAGIIFCLSYVLFSYGLYMSEAINRHPHLWRTAAFFSLCAAPLTYIYVRSILNQAYRFKKWDILFFLPAVLYTAQLIPFYALPATEKLPYIQRAIANKSYGAKEYEGILPPGFGFLFRMVFSIGIMISTYWMLIKWKKTRHSELLDVHENRQIFRWLVFLCIVLYATYFALIIVFVFNLSHYLDELRLATGTVFLSILFICLYLLFKPNILYGLQGWVPIEVPEITAEEDDPDDITARKQTISWEQGQIYKSMIEQYFEDHAPFVKPRYMIRDLSAQVGIPVYLLSAFINQEYGIKFSEFINNERVSYLIKLTRQNPEYLDYTLEVLGQAGGFASRSAFISAVKRKTGKTPSEIFGKVDG
jgi:AraC-like DNA-binding protein